MLGKAAIFTAVGKPITIEDVPVPPVEPGGILVRVRLANICGSDLHMWRGESYLKPSPTILGHEMCAEVVEMGAGVNADSTGNALAIGDRVTYSYFYPCGRCAVCLSGSLAACPNKLRQRRGRSSDEPVYWFGAFAEYYYLRPGHFVFKVSDDLSDDVVAPVNCALAQALQALHQVRYGETVVIQGAGGLGLNATAVARERGAGKIIVVDKIPARLAMASDFGADHLIDLTRYESPEERVALVKELTGGQGVDVVAEFVGTPHVVAEGIAMLRNGGHYLLVGNINERLTLNLDLSTLVNYNKRLIGIGAYEPWAIAAGLQLLKRTGDKYPFRRLLSHRFPLSEINTAFAQAADSTVVRASLVP